MLTTVLSLSHYRVLFIASARPPRVVCCDVVWCNVVWCGVLCCAVLWCGVMRCGLCNDLQIFDVLRVVGKQHELSAALIIGGKDLASEQERIANMNIIVCTPGDLHVISTGVSLACPCLCHCCPCVTCTSHSYQLLYGGIR